MRLRVLLVLIATLGAMLAVATETPSSAAPSLVLAPARTYGDTVVLKGRAPAGVRVRVVRRVEDGWKRVAVDRADRRGRYRMRVDRPTREPWVVRAVAGDLRSGVRTVMPVPAVTEPVEPPVDPDPIDPGPVPPGPVDPTPVDQGPPPDACGKRLPKGDGTYWECTFVDNFDGTELDTSKWMVSETRFSGVTNGAEGCFRNEPWIVSVAGGVLRLSARRTEVPFVCDSPLGDFMTPFASAAITTRGRFNQAFGRFEFRAAMPTTRVRGAHSALWLYPNKHTYGPWPLSGEIDVAEWYSALPNRAFPSVHYVDGLDDVHSGRNGVIEDVSTFHTYALEWTPTTMRFYYDDVLTFEHSWTPLAPLTGSQPFDQPFNVVLNQAWGGLWNSPTDASADINTMRVDSVRVWK